jgi:two-component system alkaline phosphatase synthesis response regulator PhoP
MEINKYRILLVDDEPDILDFVGFNLQQEGYQVASASNGAEAIDKAKEFNPHVILLDVMMPVMDGYQTCRELRKYPQFIDTIIVFFTARNEDYSQIAGLETGADDYITKPIKPAVLQSKVKSLLRRNKGPEDESHIIAVGNIRIDKEKYMVYIDGKELILPRKEFELFSLLVSKPNKVFTRDEIFDRVWSSDVIVGERTIDVHIRKIREKTGLENLKTIKGVGYKYEFK